MKKTYIIPQTMIHRIRLEQMIASSPLLNEESANVDEGKIIDADTKYNDWNIWDE